MVQGRGKIHRRRHDQERHLADRMTVTAIVIDLNAVRLSFFCFSAALMLVLMMTKVGDVYR